MMTEEEKEKLLREQRHATTRLRFMIYYLFNSRIPGGFAVCDTSPVADYRLQPRTLI